MRNFFNQLKPKTFQILCITLCVFGDLSFSGYIYLIFSDKESYLESFKLLKKPLSQAFQQQGLVIPPGFEHEIFQLMLQTLLLMISLFIIAHGLIYTFYYFKKRFAFLYIRAISFMGVLGSILFTASTLTTTPLWGLLFILVTISYLFVAFGTYYFPIHPKGKTE